MTPIRFSNLKWMARSPAHYKHNLEHPSEPSRQMRLGNAIDAMLFGHKEVLVFDGKARRGKAWETFERDNAEAVLLTEPENADVKGMVAAVQANKKAMALLKGERQKQIAWKMNGRECQGTPDVVGPNHIVELKSTRNAKPEWFSWDALKRGYHAQLAWYTRGCKMADCDVYIVSVESSAPYPVTILKLTEQCLIAGEKLWRLWFERLMVCEQSNSWPEYTDAVVPMDAPDSEALTLTIDGEEVEV